MSKIVEVAYRRGNYIFESLNGQSGTFFEECERAGFLPGDVLVVMREDDYKALVSDAEVTRNARKYRPHVIGEEIAARTGRG